MARPKKDNAEYFSHDNDMRNDPKIKALRKRFPIVGYAIYNMLLEVLTGSENLVIEVSPLNLELLAGDFDCDSDTLTQVIDYAVKIQLFIRENQSGVSVAETPQVIFSAGLKKRLQPVFEKREKAKSKFLKQKQETTGVSVTENPVSASETTQSKVKESKVKESKVKEREGENAPAMPAAPFEDSSAPLSAPADDGLHPILLSKNRPKGAPTVELVQRTFNFLNAPNRMRKFFEHYEASGWLDGAGRSILMNWESKASQWVSRDIEKEQTTKTKAAKAEQKDLQRNGAVKTVEELLAERRNRSQSQTQPGNV